MSPSGELLRASNSMRQLMGKVLASHTPWLCAPLPHSRPPSMRHSGPVVRQSLPNVVRSKLSSKPPAASGGDGAAVGRFRAGGGEGDGGAAARGRGAIVGAAAPPSDEEAGPFGTQPTVTRQAASDQWRMASFLSHPGPLAPARVRR